MPKTDPLQGLSAIVTGSGRGIGAATAVELASRGARLVLNYLNNAEAAESVGERIRAGGGEAVVVQADVATEDGANALAEAALSNYGAVDVMVSNAGPLFRPIKIIDMTWDDLHRNLDQDMRCAFFTTKAVLPGMLERKFGRLIYIGSTASMQPTPMGIAHHGSSRAALTAFAQYVAIEFGGSGITSNVVAPGTVRTDRTAAAPAEIMARMDAMTPVGRVATPEDVARAVAFFAADTEGFYTNTVFPVDGGRTS